MSGPRAVERRGHVVDARVIEPALRARSSRSSRRLEAEPHVGLLAHRLVVVARVVEDDERAAGRARARRAATTTCAGCGAWWRRRAAKHRVGALAASGAARTLAPSSSPCTKVDVRRSRAPRPRALARGRAARRSDRRRRRARKSGASTSSSPPSPVPGVERDARLREERRQHRGGTRRSRPGTRRRDRALRRACEELARRGVARAHDVGDARAGCRRPRRGRGRCARASATTGIPARRRRRAGRACAYPACASQGDRPASAPPRGARRSAGSPRGARPARRRELLLRGEREKAQAHGLRRGPDRAPSGERRASEEGKRRARDLYMSRYA